MSGLEMNRIRHAFGNDMVLDDVSLVAGPGKLTCLLGPSGCGKTTLLRLAAGLESLQQGQVAIQGVTVADGASGFSVAPEKRDVGLMFQDYALFPHLNVFENIAFGIENLSPERRQWIKDSLEHMGLSHHTYNYPHTLSGGQQQRVALLRALAPEPGVLLLDEPFSGLDVTRRAQVREEALTFLKQSGVAVMMVTHDPEEAMFMADHIVIMNEGRVVQAGTPVQTYFHPVSAFVTELFGPVNRCRGTVTDGQAKTQLGTFDAPGFENGTEIVVMLRPEAILISPSGEDVPAKKGTHFISGRVDSTHPLGSSSHLHIIIDDGNGGEQVLHVRTPGISLPAVGSSVNVSADMTNAFIFPAD
ncbi:MAG: ABC transporter ATP-binding protein [Rhodospirillaceae bacterium]|nr:ABC transporter ATP-binding protein [Rhodospirillaceae bacterium]